MKSSRDLRVGDLLALERVVDDLTWILGFLTPATQNEDMTTAERNRLVALRANLPKAKNVVCALMAIGE